MTPAKTLAWGGLACVVISIMMMVLHWFDTTGKEAFIFLGITGLMALLVIGSVQ